MPVQVHEPFPSVATTKPAYLHSGRGGAGNLHRTTPTSISQRHETSTTQLLQRPHLSSSASAPHTGSVSNPSPFTTGRGGAGNVHSSAERTLFSFDEELERLGRAHAESIAPVYHIGRGGAGNLFHDAEQQRRMSAASTPSSRKSYSSSEDSRGPRTGSLDWVRGHFKRGPVSAASDGR
jgi:hypothetical protein